MFFDFLSPLLRLFYNETALLGEIFIKVTKKVGSLLLRFVGKPLLFLLNTLLALGQHIFRWFIKALRSQIGDTTKLQKAVRNLKRVFRKQPLSAVPVALHYTKKGLGHYRHLLKQVSCWLIPITAAVIMIVSVGSIADVCIALRIDTNGETLGFVSNESEYLEARDIAKERLGLGTDNTTNSVDMLPSVTYTLSLIKINQYTNTQTLCDRLIEKSSSNIIHACGVYVAGEFLCAVKNEADAKRVFNTLLEEVEATEPDGIVSFVQDIDYIEGLYPDRTDVVWDSSRLLEYVKSKEASAVYHTVELGDSFASIANRYNISLSELYSMNPEYRKNSVLRVGNVLTVALPSGFFTVQVTKTKVYTEEIPYDTIEIQSDALYTGTSRIVVNGVNGLAQVTSLISYVDGKQTGVEEVSRLTVKDPVAQRIQVGTKPLDADYPGITSHGGILIWPTVNAFNINSDYGYRWGKLHSALDIGSLTESSMGKLVVAAAEGRVVIAGVHPSYGYYVKIDHGNGMQTLYAHCKAGSLMVKAGDKVTAGQPIARIGMTGFATGPHLHFEVIINGSKVNPRPYLGIGKK